MTSRSFAIIFAVVAGLASSVPPSRASFIVETGWDLFATSPTTFFDPDGPGPMPHIPLKGVPLVSFDFTIGTGGDFGRSIGTQTGLFDTDTIVKRLNPAIAPGIPPGLGTAAPISLEMVALQLQTVNAVDLGLGTDFYFVSLQSARGGPASGGSMTITFGPEGDPHGTFHSILNVAFDIRKGALTGPIALSQVINIDSVFEQPNGVPWTHFPPPSAVEITGVDRFLNGTDRSMDFWPGIFVFPGNVNGGTLMGGRFCLSEEDLPRQIGNEPHDFCNASTISTIGFPPFPIQTVPEPGSFALFVTGGLFLTITYSWRRRVFMRG